jgi:hypothetical protein
VGSLGSIFGIDVDNYLNDVEERKEQLRRHGGSEDHDWDDDRDRFGSRASSTSSGIEEVDSMFDSLRFRERD